MNYASTSNNIIYPFCPPPLIAKLITTRLLHTFCTIAFIATLCGGTFALAEDSGIFIGVGYGYGEFRQEASGSFDINGTPIATGKNTIKTDGFSVGVLAGYKYFFNPFVGVRAYANVDVSTPEFEADGGKEDATLVNYGGNLDLLVNFIANEKADFGLFAGVGVGGNWWISKDIAEAKRDFKEAGFRIKDSGLDVALNAGLRVNAARQHSAEIGVRVPFKPVVMLDETLANAGGVRVNMKLQYAQMYSVFARYIFSF